MNPFVVPTKFTAVDQMSGQVRTMAHNVHDSFSRLNTGMARSERLFRRMTPTLSDATKQIMNYGAAGSLLAGAAFSGKAIMDYETAVQSLSAVTGVSGEQLEEYKTIINDIAEDTEKSATDITGSFEVIGSMMSQYLKNPKALREIAEAGITLSKASRQELVPSLEQLTSIMNQFDIQANKAGDTVDRLTAGEIVGSLKTGQVTEALQEFGAGAYSANIDISESVALVEALAKQMKTDKIGVGARNILTVMDSATGLSKKARKELRHAGVDMHFLMDKSNSLSARLHELSKLQGNAKAITKIFGHENKTAAQVIFNQLGVYDQYVKQIRQTSEAHKQAETNSKTFRVTLEELKNTWVNYLVESDNTKEGLKKVTSAIQFVKTHLDDLVNVGVNAVKFFVLWKGAILAQRAVLAGYNITMLASKGISQAFFLVDMVKYVAVTQGMTKATAAMSIVQAELNAIWLANPIGVIVVGLAALAAATYWAVKRTRELKEEYKERINLDISADVDEERRSVEKLVEQYVMLGKSIRQANAMAMNKRMFDLDTERASSEKKIADLQKQLNEVKKRNVGIFGMAGVSANQLIVSESETAKQLAAEQEKAREISGRQSFQVQRAQAGVAQGVVDYNDVASVFASGSSRKREQPEAADGSAVAPNYMGEEKVKYGPLAIDYNKLREALQGSQRIVVDFHGAPKGTTVSGGGGTVSTPNSY